MTWELVVEPCITTPGFLAAETVDHFTSRAMLAIQHILLLPAAAPAAYFDLPMSERHGRPHERRTRVCLAPHVMLNCFPAQGYGAVAWAADPRHGPRPSRHAERRAMPHAPSLLYPPASSPRHSLEPRTPTRALSDSVRSTAALTEPLLVFMVAVLPSTHS